MPYAKGQSDTSAGLEHGVLHTVSVNREHNQFLQSHQAAISSAERGSTSRGFMQFLHMFAWRIQALRRRSAEIHPNNTTGSVIFQAWAACAAAITVPATATCCPP